MELLWGVDCRNGGHRCNVDTQRPAMSTMKKHVVIVGLSCDLSLEIQAFRRKSPSFHLFHNVDSLFSRLSQGKAEPLVQHWTCLLFDWPSMPRWVASSFSTSRTRDCRPTRPFPTPSHADEQGAHKNARVEVWRWCGDCECTSHHCFWATPRVYRR